MGILSSMLLHIMFDNRTIFQILAYHIFMTYKGVRWLHIALRQSFSAEINDRASTYIVGWTTIVQHMERRIIIAKKPKLTYSIT